METEKQTKICGHCGRELPLTSFSKCAGNPDGYQYRCKECQAESSKRSYAKKKAKAGEMNTNTNIEENPLSAFKPRELIQELVRRGYRGKLTYTHTIEL